LNYKNTEEYSHKKSFEIKIQNDKYANTIYHLNTLALVKTKNP